MSSTLYEMAQKHVMASKNYTTQTNTFFSSHAKTQQFLVNTQILHSISGCNDRNIFNYFCFLCFGSSFVNDMFLCRGIEEKYFNPQTHAFWP